ncbi:MAG: hypothetical protein OXG56_00770 [Gammaproteobacteria bacterium]|nr:hypothetical protein [Gammaproteobacteria bacterium]
MKNTLQKGRPVDSCTKPPGFPGSIPMPGGPSRPIRADEPCAAQIEFLFKIWIRCHGGPGTVCFENSPDGLTGIVGIATAISSIWSEFFPSSSA